MPKGMIGKNHSEESKKKMRESARNFWLSLTDEEKKIRILQRKIGHKQNEETRKKISLSLKGAKGYWWKGGLPKCFECGVQCSSYYSKRCKNHNIKIGKDNPSWRGGITPLSKNVRHLSEYEKWRNDIFQNDNYTCKICGIRGSRLNVDHYPKTFRQIMRDNNVTNISEALSCKELWDKKNGRTLCRNCHIKVHSKVLVEDLISQ